VFPASNVITEKPETIKSITNTRVYDKDLVRTDGRDQKIDKFLSSTLESVPSDATASQSLLNDESFDLSGEQVKDTSLSAEAKRSSVSTHLNRILKPPQQAQSGKCVFLVFYP
jgi:hypothetical protein